MIIRIARAGGVEKTKIAFIAHGYYHYTRILIRKKTPDMRAGGIGDNYWDMFPHCRCRAKRPAFRRRLRIVVTRAAAAIYPPMQWERGRAPL